jgi:general secretion pathway protein A
MYEKHFDLKSRPFGAKAVGAGVFVGPQQAKIMNSLTKGLGASDAVVTVTGPVGVGKTTIVNRALESISPGRMVAWVGRMQLAADEVLELLLTGFGVNRQAKGTIQRFAAFRRLLAERAAAGAQVAIVVEDAHRIGIDALVELEALTAADTGDTTSANLILMGRPDLNKFLSAPELDRLRQRNRLRQKIDAFGAAEVSGYMKHCIREAGGNYDAIFDPGIAEIVLGCSEGIPRIINTLCESALTAAAGDGASRVTESLMRQVALDAFAYESASAGVTSATLASAAVARPSQAEVVETAVKAKLGQNVPAIDHDDIPDLIDDTHPALKPVTAEIAAVTSFDVEATQTQKTLSVEPADVTGSAKAEDAEFSLDDALSVDVEETNVMPGITPNLDQLAADAKRADATVQALAAEPTENIPTLSDSMRIDVEVEVKRAKSSLSENERTKTAATTPESASVERPSSRPVEKVETKAALQPQPIIPAADTKPSPVPEVAKKISAPKTKAVVAEPSTAVPEIRNAPLAKPNSVAKTKPSIDHKAESTAAVISRATPPKQPQPVSASKPPKPDRDSDIEPVTDAWSNVAGDSANDLETVAALDAEAPQRTVVANDRVPAATAKPATKASAPVGGQPADAPVRERRTPDLDALQAALDAAKKGDFAPEPATAPVAKPEVSPPDAVQDKPAAVASGIPEITLDDSLPQAKNNDEELMRVAEQIGRAHSLEDISDIMAETIFGSQALDEIAASVVANPPSTKSESPVMLDETDVPKAANDSAANKPPAGNNRVPAGAPGKSGDKAAKRPDMVNALKKAPANAAAIRMEENEIGSGKPNPASAAPAPKPRGPQPEPIEHQINTSMTQTLKALSSAQARKTEGQAEEGKKSSGLFSRFRRSS